MHELDEWREFILSSELLVQGLETPLPFGLKPKLVIEGILQNDICMVVHALGHGDVLDNFTRSIPELFAMIL